MCITHQHEKFLVLSNFRSIKLGFRIIEGNDIVVHISYLRWGEEKWNFSAFEASSSSSSFFKFKRKHFSEMSDAIFYYQKYLLDGKFIYTSFMLSYFKKLHATFVTHYYWARVEISVLYMKMNEWQWGKSFFKRKIFLAPLFILRILQENLLKQKRWVEWKRLKDLTAKTINIYYRDIKTQEYSLLFAFRCSFTSNFFECVALINSLVESSSTLFIILSTKSLETVFIQQRQTFGEIFFK